MLLALASILISPLFSSTNAAPPPVPQWNLTVYYTAVESFHHGRKVMVRGCMEMECEHKGTIGIFPASFVKAVKDEGTGRITSGNYAGKYLCWSKRDGYWLDSEPREAEGTSLIPWVSAAADSDVLTYGTTFKIEKCGVDDTDESEIDSEMCKKMKDAHWRISDRFEPGLGGSRHIDLYIGEEDRPDFISSSPKVISVKSASISIDNGALATQN
jgi:hypothetical protein